MIVYIYKHIEVAVVIVIKSFTFVIVITLFAHYNCLDFIGILRLSTVYKG